MKIGIVGTAERAVAWERHLRPHRAISEVIIAPELNGLGEVDACILLNESDERLQLVLQAIRQGYHTFLVSRIPTDRRTVEQIYHTAEEANVMLQFSHWPTLAPASQWMSSKIPKPKFIHVIRELNYMTYMEQDVNFEDLWIDELAFCLKWMNGTVHQVDARQIQLGSKQGFAMHLFLRFDSGATAVVFVDTTSDVTRHKRLGSNKTYITDCDVNSQTVRIGKLSMDKHLYFEKEQFDAAQAAESAALQFIKAIQLGRPSLYNGYDALQLCTIIERVNQRLQRF